MPNAERKQQRYQKSSSFNLHLGCYEVLPKGTSATILLEDWEKWRCGELSLCQFPTLLDPDLAPAGIILFTRSRLVGLKIGRVFLQVSTNKEGGGGRIIAGENFPGLDAD